MTMVMIKLSWNVLRRPEERVGRRLRHLTQGTDLHNREHEQEVDTSEGNSHNATWDVVRKNEWQCHVRQKLWGIRRR